MNKNMKFTYLKPPTKWEIFKKKIKLLRCTDVMFLIKKMIGYDKYRKNRAISFNRTVARSIRYWFEENFKFGVQQLEITNIKAKNTKKEIKITVELCRPGLFIGKGGSTIDSVTEHLSKCFNKPVKIHIKESHIWY